MSNRENIPNRLEARLRVDAPRPGEKFVADLTDRMSATPSRRAWAARAVFATGATAAMAGGLAAVGGVSHAATVTRQSVEAVERVVAPARPKEAVAVRVLSAGTDQYRPGYGFGDPNHNHEGPPQVGRVEGTAGPVQARASGDSLARTVTARVSFSEQAGLWISVVDGKGAPLLLTQRSRRGASRVGTPLTGRQTKFVQYALLVPRTVTISLRIPANLLRAGAVYRMRILAIDAQGNRSMLLVPFRA